MLPSVLSIAGFDGSGGAGIQADLKTISALGCYGTTVLTALPIQNTCGVRSCYELPLEAIEEQLEAIFDDIVPQCIKIGMLFNSRIIDLVSNFLKSKATHIPIVLDPVTVAKSGHALLLPEAIESMKCLLMPLATLITPNLPEAFTFTNLNAYTIEEMPEVAQQLLEFGSEYVLLKGGHLNSQNSNDLLLGKDATKEWFLSPRINTKNTHGTGCSLSSAIAAALALDKDIITACRFAKNYLHQAIDAAKEHSIGKGNGPVHHFYHLIPPSF